MLKKTTTWEAARAKRRDDANVKTIEDDITEKMKTKAGGSVEYGDTYKIERGDTLEEIAQAAQKNGLYEGMNLQDTIKHLQDTNSIKNPSKIYVGQKLTMHPFPKAAETAPAEEKVVEDKKATEELPTETKITREDGKDSVIDGPVIGDTKGKEAITHGDNAKAEVDRFSYRRYR